MEPHPVFIGVGIYLAGVLAAQILGLYATLAQDPYKSRWFISRKTYARLCLASWIGVVAFTVILFFGWLGFLITDALQKSEKE